MVLMVQILGRLRGHDFTAGVVLEHESDGEREWIVKQAAPIIKYMLGWGLEMIQFHCAQMGWTATTWRTE